jgi:hypothetical protein
LLNGDAHHSEVEGELRFASDPLPIFKQTARMIPERAARHTAAMASRRILYAGDDTGLSARIRDGLRGLGCFVVYSPVGIARMFIRSEIKYSLLLFDETEAGAELESYARSLSHHERTPVIIVKKSEGLSRLLNSLRRRLGTTDVP